MLRLAPSQPPLWRSASTIQFGDPAVASVCDVTPWQERLLAALVDGIPDAMLVPLSVGFGATAADALRFAEAIRPALAADARGPAAVQIELPDQLPYDEGVEIERALVGTGLRVHPLHSGAGVDAAVPVLLVAHRLVDPRRAARLTAADAVHLPMELSGDRVTVGPLVVPGRTACLACVHEHRRAVDPQWPLVAAQLLGRPAVPTDPGLLLEGALLAARLLSGSPLAVTASVTVSSASVRRRWLAHRPSERCLCRSPEGTATADAPDARSPAPRTATGYARPA